MKCRRLVVVATLVCLAPACEDEPHAEQTLADPPSGPTPQPGMIDEIIQLEASSESFAHTECDRAAADIQQAIQEQYGSFAECMNEHHPPTMGKVVLSFTIEPSGTVSAAPPTGALQACLTDAASAIRFPPAKGSCPVSIPFAVQLSP